MAPHSAMSLRALPRHRAIRSQAWGVDEQERLSLHHHVAGQPVLTQHLNAQHSVVASTPRTWTRVRQVHRGQV